MSSAAVRNTTISLKLGRRTGFLNVENCGKPAIICEIISMHLAAQANTAAKRRDCFTCKLVFKHFKLQTHKHRSL